jgi:hypothetical protein
MEEKYKASKKGRKIMRKNGKERKEGKEGKEETKG